MPTLMNCFGKLSCVVVWMRLKYRKIYLADRASNWIIPEKRKKVYCFQFDILYYVTGLTGDVYCCEIDRRDTFFLIYKSFRSAYISAVYNSNCVLRLLYFHRFGQCTDIIYIFLYWLLVILFWYIFKTCDHYHTRGFAYVGKAFKCLKILKTSYVFLLISIDGDPSLQ